MTVFLEVPEAAWVCANELAFAFRDRFPVSRGHTLIVTRRVTPDWFSATEAEQRAVLALLAEVKRQLDEERGERRARVVGGAPGGGLRIDGGPGGFVERTVSLTDLAWVIVAADDVASAGGLLDEARVNKLRYLDGTPDKSTRWIDTGWAITAWHAIDRGLDRTAR